MATFTLTVSPSYAHEWGDLARTQKKILQNALDEDDLGHKFTARWTPGNNGTLVIRNEGSTIERRHLILGESDKRNDSRMRGKFGEGFKLALLVLTRQGVKVRLQTGEETWHPGIVHSKEFGTDVLQIRTSPRKYQESVEYWISPVTKESYKLVCDRILALKKKVNRVHTEYGDLLLDEEFKGQVFVKGIFVCDYKDAEYGYDFQHLQLDRDRKNGYYYSLSYAISNVLQHAVHTEKFSAERLFELAEKPGAIEGHAVQTYGVNTDTEEKLQAVFKKRHGEDTIAVTSVVEATQAADVGLKAVVVSRALANALKTDNLLQARIESKKSDIKRIIQLDELTQEEKGVLSSGLKILACLNKKLPVRIVEFNSDTVLGSTNGDHVNISQSMLKSVGDFVVTAVHEYAHEASAEHDLAFSRATESLFIKLFNKE